MGMGWRGKGGCTVGAIALSVVVVAAGVVVVGVLLAVAGLVVVAVLSSHDYMLVQSN